MTRRKGELSAAGIDRGWPHQVALPADQVTGANYNIVHGSKRLRSYVRSVVAVTHDRCQDGFRNASSKQEGGMKPPLGRPECLASWDRSITPSAPSSASFGLQREAHCAIAPNVKLRIS